MFQLFITYFLKIFNQKYKFYLSPPRLITLYQVQPGLISHFQTCPVHHDKIYFRFLIWLYITLPFNCIIEHKFYYADNWCKLYKWNIRIFQNPCQLDPYLLKLNNVNIRVWFINSNILVLTKYYLFLWNKYGMYM